jgi:hypothetical protein
MIINIFQSIGVVFTMVLVAIIALLFIYFSYILGIGFIIITLIFVIYHIITAMKHQ